MGPAGIFSRRTRGAGLMALQGNAKGQIWILAALSLPYRDRVEAMQDIADMLGTSYALVQSQASRLRARRHAEAMEAAGTDPRQIHLQGPVAPRSALRQPTREQLMAGKAGIARRAPG